MYKHFAVQDEIITVEWRVISVVDGTVSTCLVVVVVAMPFSDGRGPQKGSKITTSDGRLPNDNKFLVYDLQY